MSDKLTKALLELATSTVKQDRLAVERLEKQYGANLGRILNELEEYTIVHQVFEDQRLNPKKQLMIICANGCLVGAIIGILTLFIKPNLTVATIPLGFIVGASTEFLIKKDS